MIVMSVIFDNYSLLGPAFVTFEILAFCHASLGGAQVDAGIKRGWGKAVASKSFREASKQVFACFHGGA